MLVFISPAKTMKINKIETVECEKPVLEPYNKKVLNVLQELSVSDIQSIMKVNEKIATNTYEKHNSIQFDDAGSPALYTYDGMQYKAMATELFTNDDMIYANEHIRILSGLYGILKPNTSIYPYRLEMQLKLPIDKAKNLYEFWDEPIRKYLQNAESRHKTYVNLASSEYSKVIANFMKQEEIDFVTCTFKVKKGDKLKVESTASKKARGLMVQYIVKNRIEQKDGLRKFNLDGFTYCNVTSTQQEYIFIKEVL